MAPLLVVHILGSVLVGLVGRRRKIGFIGFLLVSLLLTPLITLVILFVTGPRKPRRRASAQARATASWRERAGLS